jgi:hypothetical protein
MTIRIAALMVSAALAAPMLPATADPSVVHTDAGAVRGTVTSAIRTFHGIPYAAPPRFQPATGLVQSLAPRLDSPRRPKDQAPEAGTAPERIGPVDLGAEHRCGFWSTID